MYTLVTRPLGEMLNSANLPLLTFSASGPVSGLDILAAAAASSSQSAPATLATAPPPLATSLNVPGPYNPAASLPPKVAKKILNLEFVEMSELRADMWVDEPPALEGSQPPRRSPAKPPVTDIKLWLECYGRMAALLVTRFPEKGPELWAYQNTVLRAAHNYEGSNWVAYDRQFRRDMLARRDLNWSTTNARLYNEAFTGRAKIIPRCQHCLCEDHATALCPHNPNPPYMAWFTNPYHPTPQSFTAPAPLPAPTPPQMPAQGPHTRNEVCRGYNDNRCRFSRCRYWHVCSDCFGPHPATLCPRRALSSAPGPLGRNRQPNRPRQNQTHPYPPVRQ